MASENRVHHVKQYVEGELEDLIDHLFVILRLGRADWDLDEKLIKVMLNSRELPKIAKIMGACDKLAKMAEDRKTKIDTKYTTLIRLYYGNH